MRHLAKLLAALAVLTAGGLGAAQADTPEFAFNPNVTLTVAPSDGLRNNQAVQASGAGFTPLATGDFALCDTGDTQECARKSLGSFTARADGTFGPVEVRVPSSFLPVSGGSRIDCSVTACVLLAVENGHLTWHHVSFRH